MNFKDLKALYKENVPSRSEDLQNKLLSTILKIGHRVAIKTAGYESQDINGYMQDSVQPCFCNFCLTEDIAEPDAEFPCPDCGIGIVKSITNIVLEL